MHHLETDKLSGMKKQYQQLTTEEREKIQEYRWEGLSNREIGYRLGRDHTTIDREVKRNGGQLLSKYGPRTANQRAKERIRQRGARPRLKNEQIRQYVLKKLRKRKWSPEQIAGRLERDHPGQSISPEAIYQFIYASVNIYGLCRGEDLRIYLKRKHKRRKRRNPCYASRRQMIPNRIGIGERPAVVAERKEFGHWEGDAMVSRKSLVALNTIVERVSGLVLISKLPNLTARETSGTIIRKLEPLPRKLRKTMTMDNGHENADHETVTKRLGTKFFFCNPYHSWEKGTNENTNGLIRWYLPKGTDFAKVDISQLRKIEYALNTRPRKRLNYQTPLEVFNQASGALKC